MPVLNGRAFQAIDKLIINEATQRNISPTPPETLSLPTRY